MAGEAGRMSLPEATGWKPVPQKKALAHAFGLLSAIHELPDRLDRVHALEEHGMNGGGDGHLDAVLVREGHDGLGGGHALDDVRRAGEELFQAFAAAERFAAGAVAPLWAKAGGGEVADARDAEEGLRRGAHRQ